MYYIDGKEIKLKNHSEIRTHFGKQRTALPRNITDDLLLSLNVLKWAVTQAPVNDVVSEVEATFIDGVLTQQWSDRAYNESEKEIESQKLIDKASHVSIVEMVQALADNANGDSTMFDKIKTMTVK